MSRFVACILLLLTATGLTAQEVAEPPERTPTTTNGESRQVRKSVCLLLELAAHANGLPVEFFVPIDLAGKPIPAYRDRAVDPERKARFGNCAIHAGYGSRT